MNRNPILVRKINHLTDARYFAAMGVDWMSIELNADPGSFLLWHTLKEWISGVKLAAEINSGDEMVLAKAIIDAVPEGLVSISDITTEIPDSIALFFEVSSPDKIPLDGTNLFILPYEPGMPIKSINPRIAKNVFLQAKWTPTMLEELLEKGYTGGICFMGENEDKTGIRDYGLMDELLSMCT